MVKGCVATQVDGAVLDASSVSMPAISVVNPELDRRIVARALVVALTVGLLPGVTLPRTGSTDVSVPLKLLLATTIWVPDFGVQSPSSVRLIEVKGSTFRTHVCNCAASGGEEPVPGQLALASLIAWTAASSR